MPQANKHLVETIDGQRLAVIELVPQLDTPKGVIQFHAGTVIRKEFYLKFGHFLCAQGYVVILFDYRGVGESRPASLRGYKAGISDWGSKDASAILKWICTRYPQLHISLMAHSMGGQILGLMPEWAIFNKIVLIASSSGNWNHFSPSYRSKVKRSTNLFFPIIIPVLGYVPGFLGFGADWPRGVAQQWWDVCRYDLLMKDYLNQQGYPCYFEDIDTPITAYFLSDDHMATELTMPHMQMTYPRSEVTTHMLSPSDFALEKIGHFGPFKEWTKGPIWEQIASSLLTQ